MRARKILPARLENVDAPSVAGLFSVCKMYGRWRRTVDRINNNRIVAALNVISEFWLIISRGGAVTSAV